MDKMMQEPLTMLAATTLASMVTAAWLVAVTTAMINPAGLTPIRSPQIGGKRV